MEEDRETSPELVAARTRMSMLAAGLVKKFGPLDTVATLTGAAVGVLTSELGRELAVEYLRGLADGIEADPDSGAVGHA